MAGDWLNYHHLQYFWAVARQGSIVKAAEDLGISQPTISLQLQELERACKRELFERRGRTLVLTDTGRMVYSYADQIFSLGRELADRIREHGEESNRRLIVGVSDSVSKIGAWRLLEPAVRAGTTILCRDEKIERLLPELAGGRLDVVLSDVPAGAGTHLRVFNHYLGECELRFYANHEVARRLVGSFPKSLDGFPMIIPTHNTLRRKHLDCWLKARGIRPSVIAEVEDAAMITSLGYAGVGVYPAPSFIDDVLRRTFGAEVVGVADGIVEKFHAITAAHVVTHPLVKRICDEARRVVFSEGWKAEERRNRTAKRRPQSGGAHAAPPEAAEGSERVDSSDRRRMRPASSRRRHDDTSPSARGGGLEPGAASGHGASSGPRRAAARHGRAASLKPIPVRSG